jgi:hypothetical protein
MPTDLHFAVAWGGGGQADSAPCLSQPPLPIQRGENVIKRCVKITAFSTLLSLSIGLTGITPAIAKSDKDGKFVYLPGDFHQHSLYTDGGRPFFELNRQNYNYGLDWWANSEHGGERNRDGVGHYWDDPSWYPENPILGDYEESGGHQEMWRWQSLRDYVYPDIERKTDQLAPDSGSSSCSGNPPLSLHRRVAITSIPDEKTSQVVCFSTEIALTRYAALLPQAPAALWLVGDVIATMACTIAA